MADNTTLNTGSGGDSIATDDIGGVKYPRSKIIIGADGTNDGDVSSANPLPALLRSEFVDDAAFTAATSRVLVAGAVFDDTTPDSVDEGDAGAVRMSANRCQYVAIRDNAGNERGLNVDASGNIAVTQSGTWNITNVSGTVSLPTGAATAAKQPALGTAGTASVDVITVQGIASMTALQVANGGTFAVQAACTNAGTFVVQENGAALTALQLIDDAVYTDGAGTPSKGIAVMGTDGTNPQLLSVTSGGVLNVADAGTTISVDDGAGSLTIDGSVSVTGNVNVTNSGTFAVQSAQSGTWNIGTLTSITDAVTVAGSVAHDSADSGNPHKIGAKAITAVSGVTAVASADRTDLYADLDGVLPVRFGAVHGDFTSGNAASTDGASTAVIAAAGAGIKTYLTDLCVTNTSTTHTYCEIKDGTTVKWTVPVPANGGVTHRFATPIGGTANTAWNFDMGATIVTAYCSMSGYKSKV